MRLYLPDGLLQRDADLTDLADLTGCERDGVAYWPPDELDVLVIPFVTDPTEVEQAAIRRRLVTADAAEEQRYAALLAMAPSSPFEQMWLDTELAKYQPRTAPETGA